jgi:tetratricopeptide (TPR) repeat protein
LRPTDAYAKARFAATKALSIDDHLAEAHTAFGGVLADYDWDWAEAERHFRQSIELSPNDSVARFRYSSHLRLMGRFDEAIAEAKRAQDLDPLSPLINANLGNAFYGSRQYDRAISQLKTAIELEPRFGLPHFILGLVYIQKKDYAQAISELQKCSELEGKAQAIGPLGYVYAISGKRDQARELLSEANRTSKQRYVPYAVPSIIYLGLGEKNRAMDLLEKAYQERQWHIRLLKIDPLFDNLRSEPRFTELMKRVRLAP